MYAIAPAPLPPSLSPSLLPSLPSSLLPFLRPSLLPSLPSSLLPFLRPSLPSWGARRGRVRSKIASFLPHRCRPEARALLGLRGRKEGREGGREGEREGGGVMEPEGR